MYCVGETFVSITKDNPQQSQKKILNYLCYFLHKKRKVLMWGKCFFFQFIETRK